MQPSRGVRLTARGARCAGWLLAIGLCSAAAAFAHEIGEVMPGRPYIEGGVSDEERLSLQARRGDFALWVVTAARGSGAYLADVRVTVTDEYSHVVWDKPVDGPWLLIDLPPGRYVVEARFEGQAQRRVTRIMPGDHHKLFFHFEADVDRSPGAPPRAQRVGRAGR